MTTKQNKITIDWKRQYFQWNSMKTDASTLFKIAQAARIRIQDALYQELNNHNKIIADMFEHIQQIAVCNAEHGHDAVIIYMGEHIILEYPDCIKSEIYYNDEWTRIHPSTWTSFNTWQEMIIHRLTQKIEENGLNIKKIEYNIHCGIGWSFNIHISWV